MGKNMLTGFQGLLRQIIVWNLAPFQKLGSIWMEEARLGEGIMNMR